MSETDPREQTQNDLPGSFSAAHSGLGLDQLRDSDGDGLSDLHEVAIGTNPNRFDSDGDGVSDRLEAEFSGVRDNQIQSLITNRSCRRSRRSRTRSPRASSTARSSTP